MHGHIWMACSCVNWNIKFLIYCQVFTPVLLIYSAAEWHLIFIWWAIFLIVLFKLLLGLNEGTSSLAPAKLFRPEPSPLKHKTVTNQIQNFRKRNKTNTVMAYRDNILNLLSTYRDNRIQAQTLNRKTTTKPKNLKVELYKRNHLKISQDRKQ